MSNGSAQRLTRFCLPREPRVDDGLKDRVLGDMASNQCANRRTKRSWIVLAHFHQNAAVDQFLKVFGDGNDRRLFANQHAQFHVPIKGVVG